MPTDAEVLDALDIDITPDPAVECPDLVWTLRRMSCPICERRPHDPIWTGSRWAIVWPHADDCPELEALRGVSIVAPRLFRRRAS